jgi:hypothetical protein
MKTYKQVKMPRGRTKKARKQHGGMKLSREIKEHLLTMGVSEVNIIKFLVSKAVNVKVVWDTSTYSFIFQLTLPPGLSLLDSFGLSLAESADTLAAFLAKTPELGTPISTFCAKISFVYDAPPSAPSSAPYPTSLQREYHSRIKETTTTAKANREADIQRMLFEQFACRRSTASFVPDVLAHAILTRYEFVTIFGKALSSTAKSTKTGVVGTPNEIFNWIAHWTYGEPMKIDVILMEMMDFERTAPGVPRTTEFGMIRSLRSRTDTSLHKKAALRMSAEIALVRGKGVTPHDFHEGNGLATENGEQLYLIDWGGLFYLLNPVDLAKVLDDFDRLCTSAFNTEQEEIKNAWTKANGAKTYNEQKLARFPCLQDLCGFFQIPFDAADRATNVSRLKTTFEAHLRKLDDFTCSVPTPQTVHRALMMVAFVDFMSNRMNFNHPYCQCGNVLSIVYPDQSAKYSSTTGIDVSALGYHGDDTADFRTFLKKFAVDVFPAHTRLLDVVAMITEITTLCPTACRALPIEELRPYWMQDAHAVRLEKERQEAEARRLAQEAEALRLAQEAEAAEALRLAQEAEARRLAEHTRRLAQEAEKVQLKAAAAAADEIRRKNAIEQKKLKTKQQQQRAEAAAAAAAAAKSRLSGVAKPQITSSKKSDALAAHQIQSAIAAQQEPQQQEPQEPQQQEPQEPQQQEPAVPTGLLSRLSRFSSFALNPKSWSLQLPSWLRRKGGGTRKHNKHNHKHKHSLTKRRH